MSDQTSDGIKMIGVNHIALEVGDIDEALEFYGRIFELELRSRGSKMAFIDMGDQFIGLSRVPEGAPAIERHIGLVVEDKQKAEELIRASGAEILEGGGLMFRDPWGNLIQIVAYGDIQFSKTPGVLGGMGLTHLEKSESAIAELREKGMD